jgi:hypothetical protein
MYGRKCDKCRCMPAPAATRQRHPAQSVCGEPVGVQAERGPTAMCNCRVHKEEMQPHRERPGTAPTATHNKAKAPPRVAMIVFVRRTSKTLKRDAWPVRRGLVVEPAARRHGTHIDVKNGHNERTTNNTMAGAAEYVCPINRLL